MNLLDVLRNPLLRFGVLVVCLLPCALQDYRTRHVSNWLTVPLFGLAWPVALPTDNLPLTFAVFVVVFVAWRWGGGLGPADGKIAIGLAGIASPVLVAGVIVQMLAFLNVRLRNEQPVRLPGAVGFYLGAVSATLVLAFFRHLTARA